MKGTLLGKASHAGLLVQAGEVAGDHLLRYADGEDEGEGRWWCSICGGDRLHKNGFRSMACTPEPDQEETI